MKGNTLRPIFAGSIAVTLIVGILATSMSTESFAQQILLNGAGSTFIFPLMDTWRVEYEAVKPDVSVNYQSIGSGGGVKQFIAKTVDFGASDAPLTPEEVEQAPGAVHIPVTIGSVVPAYNIPGVEKGLKFTGPILADIFLGKITKWNDPRLVEINPGISLPDAEITTVHRSDGSGTTYVWTDYLSAISPGWEQQIGKGKSIPWPGGVGAPGNEGVSNLILTTPNTIGYVELAYALTTGMTVGSVQNQAGNFIEPTLESTKAAAAASAPQLPAGDQSWSNITMVNAPGEQSYPITSFVYDFVFKEMSNNPSINAAKAKALVDFITWTITDGQQFGPELGYVPLPENVVSLDMQTLKSLTFNGKPVAAPA